MNPSPEIAATPTSATLLDQLRARDPAGWSRFVQLYGPLIYTWCRRWNLHPQDAADVFQDVFQVVAVRIDAFRTDRVNESLRGWLWAITRNKIADHFRRASREPHTIPPGEADRIAALEQPPEVADRNAPDPLVQRAMELIRVEFAPQTWQMFWRATVDGESPKDIAADLGVTPDAVRVAKSRILRRLRQELSESFG